MENPVDCPKVIPNMTNLKLFCVAPCQVLQLLPPQPNCKGYNFPCCYTQYNSNSSFLTATKHMVAAYTIAWLRKLKLYYCTWCLRADRKREQCPLCVCIIK